MKYNDEIFDKIRKFVNDYGIYPTDIVINETKLEGIRTEVYKTTTIVPTSSEECKIAGLTVTIGDKEEIQVGILL